MKERIVVVFGAVVFAGALSCVSDACAQSRNRELLKLVCVTEMNQGRPQYSRDEWAFEIDFTASTVDGSPASITDDSIRWKTTLSSGGDVITIDISRNSGFITMKSVALGPLGMGKCTVQKGKAF